MTDPTKTLAEKARAKELQNVLAKLNAGKTLNNRESRLLEEYEASQNKQLVTQLACAKACNVTARELRAWRERYPDSPEQIDGKEDLIAWQKFLNTHGFERLRGEDKADMATMKLAEQANKLLKQEEEIQLLKHKNAVMSGVYVPRTEIEAQLVPLVAEFQTLIEDRDVILSNWCPGHSTGEIRARMRETRDEVFLRIRNGITQLVEDAQTEAQKSITNENLNAPGQGRPKNPNSQRSKQAAKKAAKKRVAKPK